MKKRNSSKFFQVIILIVMLVTACFGFISGFLTKNGLSGKAAGFYILDYNGSGMPISKGSGVFVKASAMPEVYDPVAYTDESDDFGVLYVLKDENDTMVLCDDNMKNSISVPKSKVLGKVMFSVPVLGSLISYFEKVPGIILFAASLIVILVIIGSLIRSSRTGNNEISDMLRVDTDKPEYDQEETVMFSEYAENTEKKENPLKVIIPDIPSADEPAETYDLSITVDSGIDVLKKDILTVLDFKGTEASVLVETEDDSVRDYVTGYLSANSYTYEIVESNRGFIIKADKQVLILVCSLIIKFKQS